ncbi:MAG: DUF2325 domain-containing protein [Desulfovibrionaceae bacterium]|jgi:hypothetical protein|nr:DUF2325 domain-containing protein [Desulfovibrionaceae bacterium]
MGAALIGGMDRLKREYINEARKAGVKLKVFTGKERGIGGRLGSVDFVVLFTDKISHSARREAEQAAKANAIPVYRFHSSGVSTLRECVQGACRAN